MIRKPLLALAALILLPTAALAQIAIDFVTVGDVGNAPDPATGDKYGSVGYTYQISTYEVTNSQYVAFLNATAASDPNGLYRSDMESNAQGGIIRTGANGSYTYVVKDGFENKPVNFVSLFDAARFVNWLTNGQGDGSTETGSYDLGAASDIARFTRMNAGLDITVQYFVSSENEWYKAAYYDPTLNDGDGGYWRYPTQSNTAPSRLAPYDGPNRANYNKYAKAILDVGTYTNSASYYGTFDQEGNVAEFMDTLSGTNRIRRGSSYDNDLTGSEYRGGDSRTTEAAVLGFRIVAIEVIPEPSSIILITGGVAAAALFVARRKRL